MTSEPQTRHRIDGLEPDNLLAFLALLGLLRALETARPLWRPRAAWDLDQPPLRPVLTIAEPESQEAICDATAAGVAALFTAIDFGSATDLKLVPVEARKLLSRAATERRDKAGRYFADLCAALISDAALDKEKTARTSLAHTDAGNTNFLDGLLTLSRAALPEQKSRTRDRKFPKNAADCIAQALFGPWERRDRPAGLRWDPDEAKRHAYQWKAPTDVQGGPKTQHGANRLALVGLSALTAVPAFAGSDVRLSVLGGDYDRNGFTFAWPIWRLPASFAAVRALLSHPKLREPQALDHLGVDHIRVTRRISLERYRNFTHAEPLMSS
jgi:hypothetical protein